MSANASGHGGKPFTKNDPRAKPFPKGISGNPGGRPRSLSHYIREQTNDGVEIVDFFLLILRNGSLKLRLEAAKELLDRGWGRPMHYHTLRNQEEVFDVLQAFGKQAEALFGEEAWKKIFDAARAAMVETENAVPPY